MDNTWLTIETKDGELVVTKCAQEAKDEIVVPEGVSVIDNAAFRKCRSITSVVLPDSVISIGDKAFLGCSDMERIILPNSLKKIGNNCFAFCKSLTAIKIPKSITEIGICILNYCPKLFSIIVDRENEFYDSREGCNAIIETKSNKLICGCNNSFIPDSIAVIEDAAFDGCKEMSSISIPTSVKEIGIDAFHNCEKLEEVALHKDLSIIYENAFDNCISLCKISILNLSLAFNILQNFDDYFYGVNHSKCTLILPHEIDPYLIRKYIKGFYCVQYE
mgnify:CR=1 FL=1